MYRHRGRPRWEDIVHRERMIEHGLAYEYEYRRRMDARYYDHPYDELYEDEYELAYRRRIHELEYEERMRERDMAHREKMLMEDRVYLRERFPMGVDGEDESLPPPPVKPVLPFPPAEEIDAAEHLYGYGEEGDKGQESWNPGGAEGKGFHPTGGYGSYRSGRYGSNPSGGCSDHKDQENDGAELVMEERDDEMTNEQKLTFKVKRTCSIPPCYTGPCFECEYSEFTIRVSPITYADTTKSCFSSITANASSIRINLGMKKDGSGHLVNSHLILMAKAKNVRDLLRGVIMQDFASETFTISVEQRRAGTPSDKIELVFYPTLIHKASFRINNKSIRDHMNRITLGDDNSSQKQSALNLLTLPKNVDWSFLRILFPLSVNGQVIEGEPRSAFVHLKSAKMAVIHLASITGLTINGQLIHMKTDVPSQEAIHMLQEEEAKSTSSPSAETTPSVPKKKKNLSPSDIRRNMRKKVELEQQMAKKTMLPAAPPFPGVPNLLNMSFKGPGNIPHAAISAFSGRGTGGKSAYSCTKTRMAATGAKGTSAADSEEACSIQNAPIPQILEGPYPPASEYYAPGTPSTPGASQKVRTEGYFRRNRARLAIKIAHHWGCDIEKAGKALARSSLPLDQRPPIVLPPPDLLCVKPMTEVQLQRLKKKVHGLMSVADLQKAEGHWQRKCKKRLAAGLSMHSQYVLEAMEGAGTEGEVSTTTHVAEMESSLQKPAEYNRKTSTVEESTYQENRSVGLGNNKAFTVTSSQKFQHNQGTSGQAGRWNKQQATKHKPSVQPQPFRAPAPNTSPQSPQNWNQFSNNQDQSLMPPPPPPPPLPTPPPFKPPPSTQNQFFHPSAQNPAQPDQNQFSHPPPPLSAQAPVQPQSARPPQGQQHPHQASSRSMPPPQKPYPKSPSPRPTSTPPQYQYSQPASSWDPASASGSVSRPPAQVNQNQSDQHRPPSASHQQGSTQWWQTENQHYHHHHRHQQQQQQQQPWRRDSFGECGETGGQQSYNPYSPQQYKNFWQSGGSLNDRQDTTNSSPSPMHSQYYGQQ